MIDVQGTSRALLALLLATALLGGCASPGLAPSKAITDPQQANRLGLQAWRDGELVRAELMFANALAQYRSIDHIDGQLSALTNLATVELALGEHERARQRLDAAWQLAADDAPQRGQLRLLTAQTQLQAGQFEAARQTLDGLLSGPSGGALITTTLIERTRVAGLLGEDMQPWLDRTLHQLGPDTDDATRASVQRLQAAAARARGDRAAEHAHLLTALETDRQALSRPGLAATRVALGEAAVASGEPDAARRHFLAALHIQLWIHDRTHAAATLQALSSLAETTGRAAEAARWRELRRQLEGEDPLPWAGLESDAASVDD